MKTLSNLFKNNIREYGMLIALIVIMIFFYFMTERRDSTPPGVLVQSPVMIGQFV